MRPLAPETLRWARAACLVYGVLGVVFAVGLYRQAGWATRVWPWPDDELTYIYVASLAAAIAAPFLWVAWSGEVAVLAPVALDSLVITAGMAGYLVIRAATTEDGSLLGYAAGSAVFAVLSAALFRRVRLVPPRDGRATPGWLRRTMVVLAAIAGGAGIGLLARVDGIYPWDLRPETSTMFGMVYVGVAVYFAYAALHPAWPMTTGQLLGFLAYTVVLARPYLELLGDRLDDAPAPAGSLYGSYGSYGGAVGADGPNMVSLTVFLSVLTFGTAVGVWTLLLRRDTRIVARSVGV